MVDIAKVKEVLIDSDTKIGIEIYQVIMNNKDKVDEKAFQRLYKYFYDMPHQKGTRFFDVYFSLMKNNSKQLSFKQVLEDLYKIKDGLGRSKVERSFASKLLATINPDLPIIDRWVIDNLNKYFNLKINENSRDINEWVEEYEKICNWYSEFKKNEGAAWIKEFDKIYPNSKITDVKKIDFILWRLR